MDSYIWTHSQKLIFLSSVRTLNAILMSHQVRWPIGTDGEKESKESVLLAHLDDKNAVHCILNRFSSLLCPSRNSPRGVVDNVPDCDIVVSEFELQSY